MAPPRSHVERIDVDGRSTAVVSGVVPVAELADVFDRSFATLATVTSGQKLAITGPALALYDGAPSERMSRFVLKFGGDPEVAQAT